MIYNRLKIVTNKQMLTWAGLRTIRTSFRGHIYLQGVERATRESHWLDPDRPAEMIADEITRDLVPNNHGDLFRVVADTCDLLASSNAYANLNEMAELARVHVETVTHDLAERMVEYARSGTRAE